MENFTFNSFEDETIHTAFFVYRAGLTLSIPLRMKRSKRPMVFSRTVSSLSIPLRMKLEGERKITPSPLGLSIPLRMKQDFLVPKLPEGLLHLSIPLRMKHTMKSVNMLT